MTEFFAITARDWRVSIQRARAQRNEIAEQIKLHMSTNNDGWILMSERKPTQEDVPLWLALPKSGRDYALSHDGVLLAESAELLYDRGATHWKPAAADIPAPPREQTQAEKDEAELKRWCAEQDDSPLFTEKKYWHAALAYERAEVGKMLPPYRQLVSYGTGIIEAEKAIEAIRARCGGGK